MVWYELGNEVVADLLYMVVYFCILTSSQRVNFRESFLSFHEKILFT